MNEERNKFLTEAMGLCWHDIVNNPTGQTLGKCIKCKGLFHAIHTSDWNPKAFNVDFSTWSNFGRLWKWVNRQEWWLNFLIWYSEGDEMQFTALGFLIRPDGFADTIYRWLKRKHGQDT